ncbi:ribosome biogenesis GTPase Der [Sulfobacillus thermotolerans]|uniref:ribosome biogenesis GTPase Der n=1 Tax=Sulfobacillus thermotolerans TaxID=338644 RepID=UPI0033690E1E
MALVGRPNVGKSALFNRITQSRRAIVEDYPGVTRDRLYEDTDWNGREFTIIDTGGIWTGDDETLLGLTRKQTEMAIAEADVLVFVVDGMGGPTAADQIVLDLLRRTKKPVILAVNKAESPKVNGMEFYEYGLGEPILVSAVHGEGVGDLLDAIVDRLPPEEDLNELTHTGEIRIALAGRPNVGKSSLLNYLSGEERTLVTPIAGTTRDVVDTVIEREGQRYVILDTAGLRRPNKITQTLEEKTVQRTLDAIRNADVVLLLIAADDDITAQDQRIAGQIDKARKGCVVLLNKSDLIKGTTIPFQQKAKEHLRFLSYFKSMANILGQGNLRLYGQRDIVGVELGGAFKNILAIAVGIAVESGLGDNAQAAIMTRGLHEMGRLAVRMGARWETLAGLSGLGDVVATSNSPSSRNRWFGQELAKGRSVDAILGSTPMVVEGVPTAYAARDLGQKFGLPVPITTEVVEIFNGKSVKLAVEALMSRQRVEESDR